MPRDQQVIPAALVPNVHCDLLGLGASTAACPHHPAGVGLAHIGQLANVHRRTDLRQLTLSGNALQVPNALQVTDALQVTGVVRQGDVFPQPGEEEDIIVLG